MAGNLYSVVPVVANVRRWFWSILYILWIQLNRIICNITSRLSGMWRFASTIESHCYAFSVQFNVSRVCGHSYQETRSFITRHFVRNTKYIHTYIYILYYTYGTTKWRYLKTARALRRQYGPWICKDARPRFNLLAARAQMNMSTCTERERRAFTQISQITVQRCAYECSGI